VRIFKSNFLIAFILGLFCHVVMAAPPNVVSLTPSTGAINQPNFLTLRIEFDDVVIPKLGNIIIRRYSSDSIIETIPALSAKVTGSNTRTITISPDPLALGVQYYVEIEANAFSTVTNEFYAGTATKDDWTFTTFNAAGDLKVWLDASEQGSILFDGSNRITEWRDLSGNNFHFSQTNASRRPRMHTSTQSGKQQVRFLNSFLETTAAVPIISDTSRMTYFIVHQPEVLSTRTLLRTNKFTVRMHEIRAFSPNSATSYTFPAEHSVTTIVFEGNTMTLYNDSQVGVVNTNQQIADEINEIRLGTYNLTGTGLSAQYQGRIQEFRVYSQVFTDAERRAIEKELYDKWFGEPKEHAGLLMWFDASDRKTYDFTPANKVQYWINRADNDVSAFKETGVSSPFMIDNGQNDLNVFNFSADDSLRINYALPEAGKTVFYVMQSKTLTNNLQRAFFTPSTQAHHSVRINNSDFRYGDSFTSPEDDVWRMHVTSFTASDVEVSSNAVDLGTHPYTPRGTGPFVTIGDDGRAIRAYVAEIIVYNRILPESTITRLEAYLTEKWDLPAFFAEEFFVEDNSETAAQDQRFHIYFSQNFRFGTGNIRLRRRDNDAIFTTISTTDSRLTRDGRYLYIDISGLDADTDYYFEIDPGFVESADGVPYEGITDNTTWNFRTLPFNVDGLVLWLDADDDTKFDLTSQNRVISWYDKSIEEREVTQTNDRYRPVRQTYSRDSSMHVLRANNADLNLINGGLATYDIFQVFRTGVSSDFATTGAIVGAQSAAQRTYLTLGGTNRFHPSVPPGEVYQDGKEVTDLTLIDLDDFTAVYTEARNPGDVRNIYINRRENVRDYNYIAEILVFDRKKSAADRDGIFRYLMDKWRLTGPKVIASTPEDNLANASLTAANNISLTFDRDIVKGSSGNLELRRVSDNTVVVTLPITSPNITATGAILTINFATTLANDTDYYLHMQDGTVVDTNGFPIRKYDEKEEFLNFKTEKAAPGTFSVKDIDGLQLWYDVADYSTLGFSSTNVVNAIEDKSGNQRDGRQNNNSYRATINTIHQNGHDVLTNFRDFYYHDNNMFQAVDIFHVYRSPYNLFDAYGGFTGSRISSDRDYLFRYRGANFHTLPRDSYYKDSVLMSGNDLTPIDEFMLLETITDNQYKKDYQFARQESYRFNSYIGEYIIFDRKLSNGERAQVSDYLIRKWDISPLKLLDSNPRDNDVNVDINTTIELTFNLPAVPATGSVIIRNQLTGAVIQSFDMSTTAITQPSPEIVQFNLSSPLSADTRYYIEIEDDAFATTTNYGYNGFADDTTLNFKTASMSGVFEPDDLNGLELWLDAQDQGSVTITGTDIVTQWDDKSFNNRHAEMTNATYRPRYKIYRDKWNNPYVSFTNDYMELQNNGFTGKNIFYVYRSPSYQFNRYGAPLGSQVNAERPYLFRVDTNVLHSDRYPEQIYNDGDLQGVASPLGLIKRPQVHMVQPYLSDSQRNFRVGASEGHRADLDIGEIVVYNRDLSDAERLDVTRYLMQKWNISGPKITGLSPRDNDVVDSIDELLISFDEDIFPGSGNISIRNVDTDAVVYSTSITNAAEVNFSAANISIDLASPITAPGQYYVHIENGAVVDVDNLPFFDLELPTRYNLTITSDPLVYNGLQLWLDASDGAGITISSGALVSNWLDRSGNTRHASQTDTARMPSVGLVTQNGRNTMSFTDDTFELEDQDFKAVEIIQIFQVPAPEIFAVQTGIVSNYQDRERGHKFFNGTSMLRDTPALDYVQRNLQDITSNKDLFPLRYFMVNSVVQNFNNPTFDHNIASYSNQYFRGNLAELMVFDRRLTDEDREQLIIDLAEKWDIDIYPPVVVATDPVDNGTTANMFQNLSIMFDEQVYPVTGNISIVRASDGYVLEVIEVNDPRVTGWGTSTVVIDPLARLLHGSDLHVRIEPYAITDEFFNRMSDFGDDPTDWNFTTERDPSDIFFRWKNF
jgi:hypothetical protein